MPHIQAAMAEALKDLAADFPERFRPELVSIVHDLCHPDPALRGRSGAGTRRDVGLLWLQRYVSRFDILEKAARVRQPVTHA
jgi:hypothetical protein